MTDESGAEEREHHPSDPYADDVLRTFPPEPGDQADWDWDPVRGWLPPGSGAGSSDVEVAEAPAPNDPLTPLAAPESALDEAQMSGVFVHRETGTMIRILSVDESWVRYAAIDGSGRNSMQRADYDENFAKWWRPAGGGDLQASFKTDAPLVAPRNTGDWG